MKEVEREFNRPRLPSVRNLFFVLFILAAIAHISLSLKLYQISGLKIILAIQKYRNSFFDLIMRFFSVLGFENFFIMIPWFIWNKERSREIIGYNLMSMMYCVLLVISVVKILFAEERPLWVESSIQHHSSGGLEFSYPSGHAWGTTVGWLFVARNINKKWLYVLSLLIIIVTSFSRVYFGVHYPHDVLVGIGAGTITFLYRRQLYLFYTDSPEKEKLLLLGKYSDRTIYQLAIWLFSLIGVIIMLEESHKKQHLGLFYSLGSISALIIIKPFVIIMEDKEGGSIRHIKRMLIGLVPFFCMIYTGFIIMKNFPNWEYFTLFQCGVLSIIWEAHFAPQLFIKLGLARRSHFEEKDT